jgi:hypothetical protein
MSEEKRMAGEYEIFQAVSAGTVEIVMGESRTAPPGEKYMCAYCEKNDLLAHYNNIMVSDDYVEILQLFGQRIAEEAGRLHEAVTLAPELEIDDSPVSGEGLSPVTSEDDLNGRIILIKPEVFKREYRHATHQYQLCTGGFGASPNSRGSAVYCVNLYTGETVRFERRDVLAVVDRAQLPEWARNGLKQAEKQKDKEVR